MSLCTCVCLRHVCVDVEAALRTCVCADVSLEVEGVVEAFAAEVAEVSLGLAVTLDVPV